MSKKSKIGTVFLRRDNNTSKFISKMETLSAKATGKLKREIKLIYKTTKEFLKERTGDLKAFKIVFKDLADSISINSKNNSLDSSFKKEYDKENRVKRQRKEPSL